MLHDVFWVTLDNGRNIIKNVQGISQQKCISIDFYTQKNKCRSFSLLYPIKQLHASSNYEPQQINNKTIAHVPCTQMCETRKNLTDNSREITKKAHFLVNM